MSDPCRDILMKSGFNSFQADELIDKIKLSKKSVDEIIVELVDTQSKQTFIPRSAEKSYGIGASYLDALQTVASRVKKPYRAIMEFFGSDHIGIGQRQQTRWLSLLSRMTAETGLSNRQVMVMIEGSLMDAVGNKGYTPFRKDFLTEMFSEGDKMVTGNELAHKIASSIKRNQLMGIQEANVYGAAIHYKKHWMTNQYHNAEAMAKANGDDWVRDVQREINREATIENIRFFHPELEGMSMKKFDLDVYLSGIYESVTQSTSKGTGILADQFNLHRILEFKDAPSLMRYNSKYGHENLAHAIFQNLEMFQKYLTIGETMGYGRVTMKPIKYPQPEGPISTREVFNPALETRKLFRALKDMGKISSHEYSQLSSVLREIVGDNLVIGSPKMAGLIQNYIAWQSMAVLGKAMFSSVSDIGSAAIMLHHQGIGPGQAYYGLIQSTLRQLTNQLPEAERRLVFQALHTGTDGTLMSNASKYYTGMKTGGILARGANEMFHLSGLNGFTNALRNGFAYMSSNIMANNLSKSWSKLHPRYRKLLSENFDFTSKDWEVLQEIGSFNSKIWKKDANKLDNYITMDHVLERGSELKIKGTVRLANKLDNFFIQESRSAVPEAKIRDRAILFGNHDRGDWIDVTRRLAVMFRSYQSQLVRNLWPRIIEIGLPSVVHVVPYMGLGYTAIALKSLVQGKEPPSFDDPELWIDAVIHSGLAPIVGDFIGGEYGRYNHDWDEAVLGFGYSKFRGFGELMVGLWDGDKDASDVFRSIRYNAPFANLYFMEAAINYGLHYGMMESLEPGYLNRLEAQAASQDTEFMFKPSNIWGY